MVADLTALVESLRRRDRDALADVYARYHQRLYRFLLRLCGQRELAEDLFQETWLAVARDAAQLAPDSDLTAWLYAVARNRFRTHRRWAMLDLTRLLSFALESVRSQRSVEGEVEARAQAALAQAAFDALAPGEREILLLAVGEGLEAPQVAAVLGIGADAARQRLHRARTALIKGMEKRAAAARGRVSP